MPHLAQRPHLNTSFPWGRIFYTGFLFCFPSACAISASRYSVVITFFFHLSFPKSQLPLLCLPIYLAVDLSLSFSPRVPRFDRCFRSRSFSNPPRASISASQPVFDHSHRSEPLILRRLSEPPWRPPALRSP
jgi:hypothetical protein